MTTKDNPRFPEAGSPHAIPDIQGLPDERGIDLTWVGIKNFEIPIKVLRKNGGHQQACATATLSVGLSKEHKGTHMSRFVEQLTEWSRDDVLTLHLREFLEDTKERLKSPSAQFELRFRYFIDKPAPVTGGLAPIAYPCMFQGTLDEDDNYALVVGVVVPVTTLCPCSKQISDYGAHNQRSEIRAKVAVDPERQCRVVWLEDLIAGLEETASCPVYPLLKRPDEKYVTERAYDNPKFVEDVIREATVYLRKYEGITGFSLEVEAFESIHGHNAWTHHAENFTAPEVV